MGADGQEQEELSGAEAEAAQLLRLHLALQYTKVPGGLVLGTSLPARLPAGEQTPDGPVPEWHITHIVSQTDVLRLLAAHIDRCALRGVLERGAGQQAAHPGVSRRIDKSCSFHHALDWQS